MLDPGQPLEYETGLFADVNKTASGNKLPLKFAWIYSILNGSVNETHIDTAFFRCQICKFMMFLLPLSSCLSSLFTLIGKFEWPPTVWLRDGKTLAKTSTRSYFSISRLY